VRIRFSFVSWDLKDVVVID